MGHSVYGTQCIWGTVYMGHSAYGAQWIWGTVHMGNSVYGAQCIWGTVKRRNFSIITFTFLFLPCFSFYFLDSFLVWPLLPTRCGCTVLLLWLMTHKDVHPHTHVRTSLDESSAGRTWDIHAPSRVRNRNSSKRTAADSAVKGIGCCHVHCKILVIAWQLPIGTKK
jgi:hypothetical protein